MSTSTVRTTHTPGPWRVEVDSKGDVGVFADDYGLICYPQEEDYQANARLIAKAPEMRASIERMITALEDCEAGECEEAREARALLAEIEGDANG